MSAFGISDLFEAHLTVTDLDRAVAFYQESLALPLARVFRERKVAFFWLGAPGKAMLGLWQADTMRLSRSSHVAFQVDLAGLHQAPARLREAGIVPRDFDGNPTDDPVVLAWMPAASIYFSDPDGNLLEFLCMLPDPPRPELGVIRWSEWRGLFDSPRPLC